MSNLLPQPSSTAATSSSASATGNPRNKTALKPGHSLMDWVRLRGSGVDLAGTKGVVTPVSVAELKKHNKKNDAWMAIRGKVYNVTRYMDFHPGGVDELMKGVGMDATKMFDEVHAWVNYDQMLNKCYIGPLCATSPVPSAPKIVSSTSSSQLHSGSSLGVNFRLPFSISANNFITNRLSPEKTASSGSANTSDTAVEVPEVPQVIPRFDWIQKTSELVFVFYTRAFCDPGLVIESVDDSGTLLEIRILLEGGHAFLVKLTLTEAVRWPCTVKSTRDTGKVELSFGKAQPKLWSSYGTMEMTKIVELEQLMMTEYVYRVAESVQMNHDSFEVTLKPTKKVLMHLPAGHHVSINYGGVGEAVASRSYTPVPRKYLEGSRKSIVEVEEESLSMLIKCYENGTVSKYLCKSHEGLAPDRWVVNVSPPKGSFSMAKLRGHSRIAFLAAGSGITPFLGIIDQLMSSRTSNQQFEHLSLTYFNKTEDDIWCRHKLDAMAQQDKRVCIKYVLSDAEHSRSWDGERGRITRDQVAALADPQSTDHATFVGVCGPPAFNRQVVEYLTASNFPATAQHIFQG